jgi:hypothetical protein
MQFLFVGGGMELREWAPYIEVVIAYLFVATLSKHCDSNTIG